MIICGKNGRLVAMRRIFLWTFSFFIILWGLVGYGVSRSEEIQQIDAQIEDLQEVKRGYNARALRFENLAEYQQFDDQAQLETRRFFKLAEENRNRAELAQKKIDLLEARKKELQK